MDNNILTILTETDRYEIKRALKDIIIEQIKSDFEDNDCYLFDINDINGVMEEAITEIKEEIKPLLKEKLFAEMKAKLEL